MEPAILCNEAASLGSLLETGIPSTEVLEAFISNIDDKLEENSKELQLHMKIMLDMVYGMYGETKFTNPTEAIKAMIKDRILEKSGCYEQDLDSCIDFLLFVRTTLDEKPGCEEIMLDEIMKLVAQEGLALPIKDVFSDRFSSVLSMNVAEDVREQEQVSIWNDISKKLCRTFLDRLAQLPYGLPHPQMRLASNQYLAYLQRVCVLMPAQSVWAQYQGIRCRQLEHCLSDDEGTNDAGGKLASSVRKLANVKAKIKEMIREDFEVITSGVFQADAQPFKAINRIYLERMVDEVSGVVDGLPEELPKPRCLNELKSCPSDLPKSSSEAARLQNLRANFRRQKSHSVDSVHLLTEDNFTDLQAMPVHCLHLLASYLSHLMDIDAYVDALHSTVLWDAKTSLGRGSINERANLKSALKTRLDRSPAKAPGYDPIYAGRDFDEMVEAFTVVEHDGEADRPTWAWQGQFQRIVSDLARSTEMHIRSLCEHVAKSLEKDLSCGTPIPNVAIRQDFIGGRLDYPVSVAAGVWEVMTELECFFPFLKAGCDGPLQIVQAAIVDTLTIGLKSIYHVCNRWLPEVGLSVSIDALYTILSSAAYIRNHILHYDTVTSAQDSSKKRFSSLYQQYCDLVDGISRQVIELHVHKMATITMHDAEGQNWQESREFFENAECCYSIRMFYVYMQKVEHELFALCPPRVSQSILAAMLRETLTLFCDRFTTIHPSYRRTTQYRTDILALLHYVLELLYSTCSHFVHLLNADVSQSPFHQIHNSCSALLAMAAIVTSPIDKLAEALKDGCSFQRGQHFVKGYSAHWLCWVRPGMLKLGDNKIENLTADTTLYLMLQMLRKQPHYNWPLIIQLLTVKCFKLSIMLAEQIAFEMVAPQSGAASRDKLRPLVDALLSIAVGIGNQFPLMLREVLIPIILRTDSLWTFNIDGVLDIDTQVPLWFESLQKLFENFLIRVLEPGLANLCESSWRLSGGAAISLTAKLQQLPCKCPLQTFTSFDPREKRGIDPLLQVIHKILGRLFEDIQTMSLSLCLFFRRLQCQMKDTGLVAAYDCPAIQLMAVSLRHLLHEQSILEAAAGCSFDSDFSDKIRLLGDCLFHILTTANVEVIMSTKMPKAASSFMQSNRNWLSEQFSAVVEYFENEMFEDPDVDPFDMPTQEYLHTQSTAVIGMLQTLPDGEKNLQILHNLLKHNGLWLISSLDVPPVFGEVSTEEKVFTFDYSPVKQPPFNPSYISQHVGIERYNHQSLVDFEFDWTSLLVADLGMSQMNYTLLIHQRHELQENAQLEESEKQHVALLLKNFPFHVHKPNV